MSAGELRRQHERKIYNTDVIFNLGNRPYAGTLKDISMGGAFVMTHSVNQVYKGDTVTITIPYTDGKKHIQRRGRVLWTNGEGFALEFY
jgi:hypothetical protein